MRECFDEGIKACKRELLLTFKKTVLSAEKARYLSLSEKSAMASCLLEFVDICYNYIEKKDQ